MARRLSAVLSARAWSKPLSSASGGAALSTRNAPGGAEVPTQGSHRKKGPIGGVPSEGTDLLGELMDVFDAEPLELGSLTQDTKALPTRGSPPPFRQSTKYEVRSTKYDDAYLVVRMARRERLHDAANGARDAAELRRVAHVQPVERVRQVDELQMRDSKAGLSAAPRHETRV